MTSIEEIIGKFAMTTVTTVSRIALSHATNAAIRNVTSYISTQIPKNKNDTEQIRILQRQLDLKIKNLKPTIDIIARSVADGNTDLESALEMCIDIKQDIEQFAIQVNTIQESKDIKLRLKELLNNIDDIIPSLHLSLRSIESQTGKSTISLSKLVQASALLLSSKKGHKNKPFVVRLYSLFSANIRDTSAKEFTWKEEFHKGQLLICPSGLSRKDKQDDIHYHITVSEDLDDGLYHEEIEEGKGGKGREIQFDIGRIERMFYTQSGELLNIEDSKSPVLVIKVLKKERHISDEEEKIKVKEAAPDIIKEGLQSADWYAVGIHDDEGESEGEESDQTTPDSDNVKADEDKIQNNMNLLLLESAVKLALLEITEQISHLNASDELIQLYMKN